MHKLITLTAALLALCSTAHALIGDNRHESDTRYGQPYSVSPDGKMAVYDMRDYLVTAYFNDQAVTIQVVYMSLTPRRFLSRQDQDGAIAANLGTEYRTIGWTKKIMDGNHYALLNPCFAVACGEIDQDDGWHAMVIVQLVQYGQYPDMASYQESLIRRGINAIADSVTWR
jgi:hypothetical protein